MKQLQKIAKGGIDAIILREKDLTEEAYLSLASECLSVCREYAVPLIVNTVLPAAELLGVKAQLSFSQLLAQSSENLKRFPKGFGVSVHSRGEAGYAARCGADFLIAGHIFPTECKLDLPARGPEFLRKLSSTVQIPVFAIGGISAENAAPLWEQGAAGLCLMSGMMQAADPARLISALRQE